MGLIMIDVKLEKFLQNTKEQNFEWGQLDCVLFACKWIENITDINPARKSIGAYKDEKTAYAHLKKEYGSIQEGLDKHLKQVAPSHRQKGDVALCMIDGRETLGVCGARGFVMFKTLNKGVYGRRDPEILNVWRVS